MNLRSFRTAAWLGWKIESNWTDPFLFAVYSIVKPLSGAAILVVMYSVITNGNFTDPLFPYIYLGNAFYMYVGAVMTGVSWAIIDDREHYRTLKYMYVAPIRIPLYLIGRAVARFLTGSFSVFITIVFGVLFLHVPINLAEVNWLLFSVSLLMGVVLLALMGLTLAGVTLLLARHGDYLGDAVAGGLYLFSGAVFPAGCAACLAASARICHADHLLAGTAAAFPGWVGGAGLSQPLGNEQRAAASNPGRDDRAGRGNRGNYLPLV
jgi:ABC-2 type transport system permease protein